MFHRVIALATSTLLFLGAGAVGAVAISRQQSEAFARKLTLITGYAATAGDRRPPRRTAVTESEINSWFAYQSQPLLPEGVAPPSLVIVGGGTVRGDVTIDLEAYAKRRRSGGAFDPWSLVTGRVPVSITGVLSTKNGQGRFDMQRAELAGIPLPKGMVQDLVTFYSRSPERPDGIRVDDPFALPAQIRQIEVGQGQAVVVQ